MRFFFYGTLMEPEILHAVLRRSVARAHRRKAVLRGCRRVYRRGASYPVIVADAASEVQGIVVSELTTRDAALLRAYEGPEYIVHECPVRLSGDGSVRAKVFIPRTSFGITRSERQLGCMRHRQRERLLELG